MAADTTTYAALLKSYYGGQRIQNLVYKNEPFLAMLPKFTKFKGANYPIPVIYGTTRGRSSTFSTALTNKGQSSSVQFVLTRKKDYALGSIDRETLMASDGDAGAFLKAAQTEINGALRSVTRSIASALFRSNSGSVGTVGSVSTSSLTLASIHDVVNFEVGDTVTAADAEVSGNELTGSEVIAAIDRDTGVLTSTNTNWTDGITGATLSAGDYLYIQGDRNSKPDGLSAWIPASAPGATAFYGVDRSTDVVRLGGNRASGAGIPIEENCINIDSKVSREGGAVSHIFMNPVQMRALKKSLGSKVQYNKLGDASGKAKISFTAVQLDGDNGVVNVVSDRSCPSTVLYALQLDTWKAYSLGELPHVQDLDNDKFLTEYNADGVEIRASAYYNLGCEAPGWNGVITSLDQPSS